MCVACCWGHTAQKSNKHCPLSSTRTCAHARTHTHLEELSVFFRAGGTYQEENRVSESRVRYQVFFGP